MKNLPKEEKTSTGRICQKMLKPETQHWIKLLPHLTQKEKIKASMISHWHCCKQSIFDDSDVRSKNKSLDCYSEKQKYL